MAAAVVRARQRVPADGVGVQRGGVQGLAPAPVAGRVLAVLAEPGLEQVAVLRLVAAQRLPVGHQARVGRGGGVLGVPRRRLALQPQRLADDRDVALVAVSPAPGTRRRG